MPKTDRWSLLFLRKFGVRNERFSRASEQILNTVAQENISAIGAATMQKQINVEMHEVTDQNEIIDFLNSVQPDWASTDSSSKELVENSGEFIEIQNDIPLSNIRPITKEDISENRIVSEESKTKTPQSSDEEEYSDEIKKHEQEITGLKPLSEKHHASIGRKNLMLAQMTKNDGKLSFILKDGHINPKTEAGARIINIIRSYPWVDNAQLFKGKLLRLNSSPYMEAERY